MMDMLILVFRTSSHVQRGTYAPRCVQFYREIKKGVGHVELRTHVFSARSCGGGSGFCRNRRGRHADFLGVIRSRTGVSGHSRIARAFARRDLERLAVRQIHREHKSHYLFLVGLGVISGTTPPHRIFARTQVTGHEICDRCAIVNRRHIIQMLTLGVRQEKLSIKQDMFCLRIRCLAH